MRTVSVQHYIHTLRHLKPWQVVGRVIAPLRRRYAVHRIPAPPASLTPVLDPCTTFPMHDPWNTRDDVLRGRFRFLNESASLGRPVDWQASMPLLWQFNLHYFHYLHLLNPDQQVALCREWVEANPPGEGVGWHPYPTSLRIVNWCRAGLDAPDLLQSLYQQAAYLYRNVETHVGGNHLLENARALVMAGRYLQGQGQAEDWLTHGLIIYRDQTPEQILEDGFHFERSPMYHALMLEGYLDVLNVLTQSHADQRWLRTTAQEMTVALAGVRHPDGKLALFNDSTNEIAVPPDHLLDYATRVLGERPSARRTFPEAGYYVWADDDLWLMVDAGPGGPDYLMAHAHADIFSYELSLCGKQFIVDSGVYEYPAGLMRRYVRSTAAHNTVTVDATDQIECWESFRVARRAAPHDLSWQRNAQGVHFEGIFSGYARLLGDGIEHQRRMDIDVSENILHVQDIVTGIGEHSIESRVHLHPEVDVSPNGSKIRLERAGVSAAIETRGTSIRFEEGWYCPAFGEKKRNQVVVLGGKVQLPVQVSYFLHF